MIFVSFRQSLPAPMGGAHAKTVFHDRAGPVFVQGRRQVDPVLQGAETYVIFGGASRHCLSFTTVRL